MSSANLPSRRKLGEGKRLTGSDFRERHETESEPDRRGCSRGQANKESAAWKRGCLPGSVMGDLGGTK